jgi:hypothetical protein
LNEPRWRSLRVAQRREEREEKKKKEVSRIAPKGVTGFLAEILDFS